jgi:hypothetical protein
MQTRHLLEVCLLDKLLYLIYINTFNLHDSELPCPNNVEL